jgi:hypothetical protein
MCRPVADLHVRAAHPDTVLAGSNVASGTSTAKDVEEVEGTPLAPPLVPERSCSMLPQVTPPKPTPGDLWLTLVDEAGEDAITSAAAKSVAQAEQDLIAAGFDTKAERARANAHIAALTGERALHVVANEPATEPTAWVSGPPAPAKKPPSSRRVVWLAAALAAAAATGGIVYAVAHRPRPPDGPVEVPREPPSANAPAPPPVAPSAQQARPKKPPPWSDPKAPPRQPPATP